MTYKEIASPSRTREILQKHGFTFKKSLGQNFLTEPNILRNIADVVDLKNSNVIEIGPGIGALTEHLAKNAAEVLAFEIDSRLIPVLQDTLSPYENVTVVNQDVLKANLTEVVATTFGQPRPLKVVANLPYYITSPILMHLIESSLEIQDLVIMMQKEVADRISAVPSTKAYGSLSIAIQYFYEARVAFIVPKTVFTPQPNVESAILHLHKREKPLVDVLDDEAFFKLTRAGFVLRRKTLWNNLLHVYGKTESIKAWLTEALEKSEIDPKRRGETLSIEEFAKLSNTMVELRGKHEFLSEA
ncbi:MAG: 16S rRNA (adenine(1518)-N(6)/adenine(1519)-N(6))-dimethyltransferase RsmA [Streptococcaceae bacterium]|jgi:16S rRNA (adenine1518-N6/adenine1519-N6)-dimethyltransferase|nr:16S rRNA (adenine(1518)-N(6)/adenine(1519)-N(6))-dimethyltransferase RsmA [Streptococcaceae bacterium]